MLFVWHSLNELCDYYNDTRLPTRLVRIARILKPIFLKKTSAFHHSQRTGKFVFSEFQISDRANFVKALFIITVEERALNARMSMERGLRTQ